MYFGERLDDSFTFLNKEEAETSKHNIRIYLKREAAPKDGAIGFIMMGLRPWKPDNPIFLYHHVECHQFFEACGTPYCVIIGNDYPWHSVIVVNMFTGKTFVSDEEVHNLNERRFFEIYQIKKDRLDFKGYEPGTGKLSKIIHKSVRFSNDKREDLEEM